MNSKMLYLVRTKFEEKKIENTFFLKQEATRTTVTASGARLSKQLRHP
jgi:hypothetical protein